jgi:hypothetical protein
MVKPINGIPINMTNGFTDFTSKMSEGLTFELSIELKAVRNRLKLEHVLS